MARPPDATTFTIVSLEAVNTLLMLAKCKICNGNVKIGKGEREYGFAVKLLLVCAHCGETTSWSSPRVDGDQKKKSVQRESAHYASYKKHCTLRRPYENVANLREDEADACH